MAKQASKTSKMRLVELLFHESLERLLMSWDAEDLDVGAIQERLAARGVEVSTVSIRNWIKALGGRYILIFPGNDPQKERAGLDSDPLCDSGPSGAGDYHITQEPLPVK